jgi:hypothetical protein
MRGGFMEDITEEEKAFLNVNRLQAFRIYHVRTLAYILKMLKAKQSKETIDYINTEIFSTTKIKNKEFGLLLDTLTLKMKLKEGKNDKTHSGS